jgi:hypothetical protein
MSASCSAEFVTAGCMCLTDPMDTTATICGYINKQNGLVYPCDLGCCIPSCTGVGKMPLLNEDFRPSGDGALPPGFNTNLPQSDNPSPVPGGAPFAPAPLVNNPVWVPVLFGILLLLIVFAALMTLKALDRV